MKNKSISGPLQLCKGLLILFISYTLFLIYQHFNGGVPSHHFMANEAYPEISNWYGVIVIALFAFFTCQHFNKNEFTKKTLLESIVAFLYGIGIFICFNHDYSEVTKIMFLGLFVIGLLYPIYRIHIYFGIVIGMTYGFGAILPAVMIGLAVVLSWICHALVRIIRNRLLAKKIA